MSRQRQCNGKIPTDYANWKTWVNKTLTFSLSSDEVKGNLALFHISETMLTEMQQDLVDLEQLNIDAEREDGEAQQATVKKQVLYAELKAYCSDLRECLKIAYYDEKERQKLEEVGIVVK